MRTVVALFVVIIMGAIAGLHLYWALGGTTAKSSAVPEIDGQRAFSPSKAGTFLVAVALLFGATIVAMAGHLIGGFLPADLLRLLTFGLAITFMARAVGDFRLVGFFKRVRGTRFARFDTWAYAPLCLGLGVAIGYVGYSAS
jgi:hypothetical protein